MKFSNQHSLAFIAAVTAVLLSALNSMPDSIDNFLFHVPGRAGRDIESVRTAVSQYNKNTAGFYASGGMSRAGLDVITASQMLKRRIFQDINMLKRDGLLMIFDQDRDEITDISFLDRNTAVVKSKEVWALVLQDAATREPVSNIKAGALRVRYLLHREPYAARKHAWVVYEADVYGAADAIPELNMKPVLR